LSVSEKFSHYVLESLAAKSTWRRREERSQTTLCLPPPSHSQTKWRQLKTDDDHDDDDDDDDDATMGSIDSSRLLRRMSLTSCRRSLSVSQRNSLGNQAGATRITLLFPSPLLPLPSLSLCGYLVLWSTTGKKQAPGGVAGGGRWIISDCLLL